MIKVDIILISYNQDQYIREAVESIFTQKVNDDVRLRLIVADDCSVDSTLSIIRSIVPPLLENSPFVEDVIFLPTNHNLGINRNYQRAFAACDGDYIAIMEGDDYWPVNNHIQQHIDFLSVHPECSMSMNCITYTYVDAPTKVDNWRYKEDYHTYTLQEHIEWGNLLGNLSACVLRTNDVHQIPKKNFSVYMDDFLLGISMAEYGYIGVLKNSTSVYRCNENSLWASMPLFKRFVRGLRHIRLYDKLLDYRYHSFWMVSKKRFLRTYRHMMCTKLFIALGLNKRRT